MVSVCGRCGNDALTTVPEKMLCAGCEMTFCCRYEPCDDCGRTTHRPHKRAPRTPHRTTRSHAFTCHTRRARHPHHTHHTHHPYTHETTHSHASPTYLVCIRFALPVTYKSVRTLCDPCLFGTDGLSYGRSDGKTNDWMNCVKTDVTFYSLNNWTTVIETWSVRSAKWRTAAGTRRVTTVVAGGARSAPGWSGSTSDWWHVPPAGGSTACSATRAMFPPSHTARCACGGREARASATLPEVTFHSSTHTCCIHVSLGCEPPVCRLLVFYASPLSPLFANASLSQCVLECALFIAITPSYALLAVYDRGVCLWWSWRFAHPQTSP